METSKQQSTAPAVTVQQQQQHGKGTPLVQPPPVSAGRPLVFSRPNAPLPAMQQQQSPTQKPSVALSSAPIFIPSFSTSGIEFPPLGTTPTKLARARGNSANAFLDFGPDAIPKSPLDTLPADLDIDDVWAAPLQQASVTDVWAQPSGSKIGHGANTRAAASTGSSVWGHIPAAPNTLVDESKFFLPSDIAEGLVVIDDDAADDDDADDDGDYHRALPSYAIMAQAGLEPVPDEPVVGEQGILLCPYYYASGECAVPNCTYTHGEQCPSCLRFCVTDANRDEHLEYCIEGVEENAQLAELREGSKKIECGICFEIVMEKVNRAERRLACSSRYAHDVTFGSLDSAFCPSAITRSVCHVSATGATRRPGASKQCANARSARPSRTMSSQASERHSLVSTVI